MSCKYSTTGKPANEDKVAEWGERRKLPEKLSSLRRKLYQKAKREPKFRFYALYDRIYRKDVLMSAWEQVRRNRGSAGVDGVTIDQIAGAEGGAMILIDELHDELKAKTYKPQAVKRVYIPKPDGRERPLGIPTIRDRVVQTAAVLILEPIFEADFLDCSYGFRPRRSAHQALHAVRKTIWSGRREVYDLDLQSYFDTIPHDKLMTALRMRIVDRMVLKLIRMWLETPVIDERDGGGPRRRHQGTPQGGVISPLLANVFLHWFDVFFHGVRGPGHWAHAKLVRYADDAVVLAKHQGKQLRQWLEGTLESRMGLQINRSKTRVVDLKAPGESFDFLGYTFRYDRDLGGGSHQYLNVIPSKKSVAREREQLRRHICARSASVPLPVLVTRLNRHLRGWLNYFSYGYPAMAHRAIRNHLNTRMRQHLRRRSQRPYSPSQGTTLRQHLQQLGLVLT